MTGSGERARPGAIVIRAACPEVYFIFQRAGSKSEYSAPRTFAKFEDGWECSLSLGDIADRADQRSWILRWEAPKAATVSYRGLKFQKQKMDTGAA